LNCSIADHLSFLYHTLKDSVFSYLEDCGFSSVNDGKSIDITVLLFYPGILLVFVYDQHNNTTARDHMTCHLLHFHSQAIVDKGCC
jgi:hypothetical protein